MTEDTLTALEKFLLASSHHTHTMYNLGRCEGAQQPSGPAMRDVEQANDELQKAMRALKMEDMKRTANAIEMTTLLGRLARYAPDAEQPTIVAVLTWAAKLHGLTIQRADGQIEVQASQKP